MRKGIVSLGFDDGRIDNYYCVKELLKERNMPATFNIVTGYVDRTVSNHPHEYINKEQLIELYNNPLFEIANHSDSHSNDADDIIKGHKKLVEWLNLPKDIQLGFATPNCEMEDKYVSDNENQLREMGICYVRCGHKNSGSKLMWKANLKVARLTGAKEFFESSFEESIIANPKGLCIYSIPVMNDFRLEQITYFLDRVAKSKGWVNLVFHSIEKDTPQKKLWSWDLEKFKGLLQYLSVAIETGKLDVMTTKDAFNS